MNNITAVSGNAKLVLRPHQVVLPNSGVAKGFRGNTYAAYLGNQIQYTIESELGHLFATSIISDKPLSVGDNVTISFDTTQVSLASD